MQIDYSLNNKHTSVILSFTDVSQYRMFEYLIEQSSNSTLLLQTHVYWALQQVHVALLCT